MAPGRKRGAKGVKTKSELRLGDLVLAKVKGFPAWPAKISRPEDWQRLADPKKYFVQFYGTSEIAFVTPADIQAFTSESKNKLLARCQGKTVKYFAQAVKEICEEFDEVQLKNLNSVRDDDSTQTLASEAHSIHPLVDDALEVNGDDIIDTKGPDCKLRTEESSDLGSGLEQYPQKQNEVECQDVKPCSFDDENHSLSHPVPLQKRNSFTSNYSNMLKNSPSVSSTSHHSRLKQEGSLDIDVKGKNSDDGLNETNGHRQRPKVGSKSKSERAALKGRGSVVPHEPSREVKKRKFGSGGSRKLASADISKSSKDVGNEKKEKGLVKKNMHSERADDDQADAEVNPEDHNGPISRKKFKTKHGHERQGSQPNEASYPAKTISEPSDTGDDASLVKTQNSRKCDSRSPNIFEDRMSNKESKRLTSGGKAEVSRRLRVQTSTDHSNYSSEEDDIPPSKPNCRASAAMSSSDLISENRLITSMSRKTDLVLPNKVRSPVMQLPIKRRSVRLDDEDDEFSKTPIHGGTTSNTARMSDSKNEPLMHSESCVPNPLVLRKKGQVDSVLKEHVKSGLSLNMVSLPASQQGVGKRTRESSAAHISPKTGQFNAEKLTSVEVKPVSVSPKSSPQIDGDRPLAELQSKHSNKASVSISGKRTPAGDNESALSLPAGDNKGALASERSTSVPNQTLHESGKQSSFGDRRKTTPKSDMHINGSMLAVETSNENISSARERLNFGKDEKSSSAFDSKISDTAMSMKHLIAAAQARKRQAKLSYGNPFPFTIPDLDMSARGRSPTSAILAFESSKMLQLDVQGSHPASPCSNVHQYQSINQHEIEELEERRVSSGHQGTGSSLSGGTEAAVARDAFEGMIETLSRTKESIARATRLAIDCAKYGLATEVVELLIQKLENEPSLHRRVDLFFLVDSITQCSHSQRGIAGESYVSTVQAALPRLIGAAAPAGAGAQENRRQCHKVLRLWLERKILPEFVLRRYMDDIGVVNNDTSVGISSRRPARAERSFDDPIREMEGMVVDEYGSNATFQLPGLLSANVFEEDEEYEDNVPTNAFKRVDDTSLSKLTPVGGTDPENHSVTPSDWRHCILEDVDGELEMEDVSGHQKDERPLFTSGAAFELASVERNSDRVLESASNISVEWLPSPEGTPPLPPGSPPVTPPLPTSPPPSSPPPPLPLPLPPPSSPPPLLPPPPPPPPLTHPNPYPQLFVSQPQPPTGPPPPHVGPPPPHVGLPPPAQLLPVGPPPPPLCPPPPPVHPPAVGPMQPVCPPPPLCPPPLPSQQLFPPQAPLVPQRMANFHGNQPDLVVSNAHGSHVDASQKSLCFPPSGVSNAREHFGYNSSRTVEYGQVDAYMNPQSSQHRPQFMSVNTPFTQRHVHPELPPQRPPSHFPHPNSVHQNQYPPYSLPNFSDGQRRFATEEQRRMQGNEYNDGWSAGGRSCSGPPYPYEGYFGPPHERPPANNVNFQPSAPNTQSSGSQIPVHGIPMMPCRPDMSAVNWKPT